MRGLLLGIGVPLLLLLAIQLVPYGREPREARRRRAVAWDSPATLALARRACFDCHSNETRWPWYASVAPISWRVQTDVNLARKKLDFTAFDPGNQHMRRPRVRRRRRCCAATCRRRTTSTMHPEARLKRRGQAGAGGGPRQHIRRVRARGEEARPPPVRKRPR
jgi:hypothetical protein